MKKLLVILSLAFLLLSCQNDNIENVQSDLVECPESIANEALIYAQKYSEADTEYAWGRQDLLRAIKIDCSGLAVNCYKYAVNGTSYSLPFQDATVHTFFTQWSKPADSPRQGDLIFMGDDAHNPTHMSLFVKADDSNIYFIDSTLKEEYNINGVSQRFYPKDDKRFLSFGRLLLAYKK